MYIFLKNIHIHTHPTTKANKQIQQSFKVQDQLFLHTSNKQSKKEITMTIPFTTSSKGIKYLGINLTRR